MPPRQNNEITLEGVRIVFRNFAGAQKQFNDAGKRNFSVVLTPEQASELEKDGWNVKRKPPREEGDEEFCHLKVTVNFGGRPPRIVLISSKGRNQLDEDTAELLDYAELDNVDLIIRPYDWTVNDKTGRKAYLKTLYAKVHEDDLDLKYANVPDINDGQTPDFDLEEEDLE
jgi:hypothetical protein